MVTPWPQEPVSQGKDGKEQHFVETTLGVGVGMGSGDSIGKKAWRMGESDSKGCHKVMSRLTKTQSQRECHLSCGSWGSSKRRLSWDVANKDRLQKERGWVSRL